MCSVKSRGIALGIGDYSWIPHLPKPCKTGDGGEEPGGRVKSLSRWYVVHRCKKLDSFFQLGSLSPMFFLIFTYAALLTLGLRVTPVLQSALVILSIAQSIKDAFHSIFLLFQTPWCIVRLLSQYHRVPLLLRIAMKLSAFALLAPVVLAAPFPICSSTSITPCSCPSGSSYAQSVTFAVIGAAATDVEALISDCLSIRHAVSPRWGVVE